jgi:hypothetical protein
MGYHCYLMALPDTIKALVDNSTVTGIVGFVAGFITKTFGERVFGDFYSKRQLKASVYQELAGNYSRIKDRQEVDILVPGLSLDRSLGLKTEAYINAKNNVVLYSTFNDKHYLDTSYENLNRLQDLTRSTKEERDILFRLATNRIEDAAIGDAKLLRKYLPAKYRRFITGL